MTEAPLELRFVQNLRHLSGTEPPRHLLVALSGGLDSTVLLHLLRFRTPIPFELSAAHFDHRMRSGSRRDADGVRDLCSEWGVPLIRAVATKELRGEAMAREARYAFLHESADRAGADAILTAHHADDQAETVLFRILRGTGVEGLSGIPSRTPSGLMRPLLPFWRTELLEYARREGLRWLDDPTNATLEPTRNRIRLEILPTLEREGFPHARRNLVALAELARESEVGWRGVLESAEDAVIREEHGAIVLARGRLRGYDRPVQIRLVRRVLRRMGTVPSRAGTRTAVAFITGAHSGRELQLRGGIRIRIEFDDARLERDVAEPEDDTHLSIGLPVLDSPVLTDLRLGGRTYKVEVRVGSGSDEDEVGGAIWNARIPIPSRFPLLLRGRRPGDRVRTGGGSKSLKKLMIERRVPRRERARLPVLLDAEDAVLWVGGLGDFGPPAAVGEPVLELAIHG